MKGPFARFAPSLAVRLALALTLVGAVPVALLAYRLIGLNRDSMAKQVGQMHSLFARSASEQVSSWIFNQLLLTRGLANNPALGDVGSGAAQALLGETLQSWSAGGVVAIAVVDGRGEPVVTAQLRAEEARQQAARALALPPGPDVIGLAADGGPLVRIAAPLALAEGFVWVVAEGSEILQALDPFELGRSEVDVALTTTAGEDLVGNSAGFPAGARAEAETGLLQGVDLSFVDPETGIDLIGAYSPVLYTDWIVFSRQPIEIAHATARRMTRQAEIAVALVSIAILLLLGFAYVTVLRPIRELAAAQRRLAGVGGAAPRGSEIDQLRASFAALESRLKDQRALDEVFLGRYRVLELLGTGAMGSVFLGLDPRLERHVAIKTVRLGKKTADRDRRDLVARLLQEAVITARLSHPNVVAVYDVENAGDAAFIAMEYVDGINLEQLVWRVGRLDPDLVLPLGAAVARGLSVAHEANLVHRDVKPANILLGRDGAIKVVDFGIAELLSSVVVEEDVVFGTPGYLPPETLRGKGYDKAGDLFSLGSVLYYCVTGRRAFEGRNLKEIVRKTLFQPADPPSRHAPDVPPELDELLVELLSADNERRPSDASKVAERLEALARQRDAVWRPPPEAFEDPERLASGTAYLPTTPMAAAD